MTDIKSQIQGILNETEECKFAAEVTYQKESGDSKTVYLTLISHKQSHANGVFIFESKPDEEPPLSILLAKPISRNFGIQVSSEMQFNIFFPNEDTPPMAFEASALSTMWTIVSKFTRAFQSAIRKKNLNFDWISKYNDKLDTTEESEDKGETKDVENEMENPLYGNNDIDNIDTGEPEFNTIEERIHISEDQSSINEELKDESKQESDTPEHESESASTSIDPEQLPKNETEPTETIQDGENKGEQLSSSNSNSTYKQNDDKKDLSIEEKDADNVTPDNGEMENEPKEKKKENDVEEKQESKLNEEEEIKSSSSPEPDSSSPSLSSKKSQKKGLQRFNRGFKNFSSSYSSKTTTAVSPAESEESGITDVREAWIKKQLKQRENEFTDVVGYKVFVGTWNVNSKKPQEPLEEWLHVDEPADIYAFGLQEVDMTAGALLREETETGSHWVSGFGSALAKAGDYELLTSKQLVGILQCVFVRSDLRKNIHDVLWACERVGIMNMMGNKGAVAIRFRLHDSTFCFINAHFAPHMDAVLRRNQNFHSIISSINFGRGNEFLPDKHDFVFWFGDLNYRIDLPNDEVREKVKQKNYADLMEYDQLSVERKKATVFENFEEGKIDFQPSYKFDPGTDDYDTSEKQRVPSYTDRILWCGDSVEQEYLELHNYKISDHKPVCSGFNVGVRTVIESKYTECRMEVLKSLDRMENELLPECKLTALTFNFENVKYNQPQTQLLTLENTGQGPLQFQFNPKTTQSSEVCKEWMQIEPTMGMATPGETVDIKLTVWVDNTTAPYFNSGTETLEDILILHLVRGRDHFISLTGNFLKSSFGNSLDNLIKMHEPVRYCDEEQIQDDARPHLKLPKEVWRLVDYIYRHGMEEEGLFQEEGNFEEVQDIVERLDTGASLSDYTGSVHSVAGALIRFFDSLEEPVIPFAMYRRCIDCTSPAQAKHIINQLPPVHFNTFQYTMAFLRELLLHADKSGLSIDYLAMAFSQVLLRPAVKSEDSELSEKAARARFVIFFLKEALVYSTDDLLMET
eukprot:gb/GECH01006156.1/.p1 GENE.gb/GECH01006156.1/~~gb/GECH01006156.1/.p1  ORF type:complete len:1033 (+),score=299.96 gb/GECH01006156.1/:1-3099(+)